MTRRIAPLLSLVLLLVAASRAGAGLPDRDVLRNVTAHLAGYTQFTVFDSVEAEVADGRVTLRGWVTAPFKREDVARRVERVDGVVAVTNAIEVLPESQADDVLRYRIARAIYGHDAFLPLPAPRSRRSASWSTAGRSPSSARWRRRGPRPGRARLAVSDDRAGNRRSRPAAYAAPTRLCRASPASVPTPSAQART